MPRESQSVRTIQWRTLRLHSSLSSNNASAKKKYFRISFKRWIHDGLKINSPGSEISSAWNGCANNKKTACKYSQLTIFVRFTANFRANKPRTKAKNLIKIPAHLQNISFPQNKIQSTKNRTIRKKRYSFYLTSSHIIVVLSTNH